MKIKYCVNLISIVILLSACGGGKDTLPSTGAQIFSAGKYLYVFNPAWKIISRVDPMSGNITNITLGQNPVSALPVPDGSAVIVLNRKDSNVYIISPESNEKTIKSVSDNLNSLEVSPASDYAIAYHLYSGEEEDFEGILKLNEFSVVNLKSQEDDTINITLGGGAPQGVKFSPDGKRILIISRNRCFVVNPREPSKYLSIELWPDPSNIIIPAQIEITPNGRFAFIRTQNTNYLYVIDMEQVRVIDVIEGNKPTFFGIFPDGSRALLVNSGNNTLFLLRIDYTSGRVYRTEISAGMTVDSAVISAFDACRTIYLCINPDSPYMVYQAVLYSTTGVDKKILYLYLDEPTGVISKIVYGYLPAPVQSAGISPYQPLRILLTHRGITRKPYPVSIIDIIEENVNTFYLDAIPESLIITAPVNGALYAFMTLRDSDKVAYYDLMSDFSSYINVSSVPLSAGTMDNILFVLHDQPLGTITFLNLENFEKREVRGVYVDGLLDR